MHKDDDSDDVGVNPSPAPTLAALIELRLSRRDVLKGAMAGLFGASGCATLPVGKATPPLAFAEVPRSLDETHHVPAGYSARVLVRWGDPLRVGGPAFRPGAQTADEQEVQFGMDNDFVAYLPLPRGSRASAHGLLCVNHERNSPQLAWPGMTTANTTSKMTREQAAVEMASQGHTVLEVRRVAGAWTVVPDSRLNRRISARSTAMRVAGPAAGNERMRTKADPAGTTIIGTLNNCAGGVTPWGTVLTAEENFHSYFLGDAGKGREAAAWKRYGVTGRGRYVWGRYFDRFNLDSEPNEPNRFGWVVEIDPYDPFSMPVKRTALGRCKHECATTAVSHDGRVAVYSSDDERMEYIYKFVTRRQFDPRDVAANRSLLDDGTLYTARFESNGTMRWLPLVFGEGPLTAANGFASQADVVIELRRAADLLGATPMDRPEDVEAHPETGRVYVVLTSNERRKPEERNPANPRAPNPHGHILEIVPPLVNGRPDHAAEQCDWGFFLLGGNPKEPSHEASYAGPVSDTGWLAAPDNVAFDTRGRIWIATDGQDDVAGFADGLYAAQTDGPARGVTRCFLTGPRGAEICGPDFTPDGTTMFVAIQHPAEERDSTFDRPSTRWPDFLPGVPPRPSVLVITRSDGGEIGG